MYPLNVIKAALGTAPAGFALANDEAEHQALTMQGYEPAYVEPARKTDEVATKESIMAALDADDIEYDKRLGIEKLKALLPK